MSRILVSTYTLVHQQNGVVRERYLLDLFASLLRSSSWGVMMSSEHHLILQGLELSDWCRSSLKNLFHELEELCGYHVYVHEWEGNVGVGMGGKRIISSCKGELICKMDHDVKVLSEGFFDHAWAIHRIIPECVFSAFPVGTSRPGGQGILEGRTREVGYCKSLDTYYGLRPTRNTAGLCRFAPRWVMEQYPGSTGLTGDDSPFSQWCIDNQVPIYHCENAVVVEHNESTAGQGQRWGGGYFPNKRSGPFLGEVE